MELLVLESKIEKKQGKNSCIENIAMPKISDCNRCSLYAHNPYLVCAEHPDGVETDKCMDFRPDPNAQISYYSFIKFY